MEQKLRAHEVIARVNINKIMEAAEILQRLNVLPVSVDTLVQQYVETHHPRLDFRHLLNEELEERKRGRKATVPNPRRRSLDVCFKQQIKIPYGPFESMYLAIDKKTRRFMPTNAITAVVSEDKDQNIIVKCYEEGSREEMAACLDDELGLLVTLQNPGHECQMDEEGKCKYCCVPMYRFMPSTYRELEEH